MTAQDDNLSPHAAGDEPTFDRPSGDGAAEAPASDDVEKFRAELAEAKDRALRAAAELENFRRRAEKEREDTAKYAIANFAREMLTVADNLRRALDAQPKAEGEQAAALQGFVAGVELTERELAAIFERFGIKRIEPLGQPFDHDLHQAMFEIEDASKPAGTVLQVLQAGYTLKERLLRPALVGVAKGGPAQAAAHAATGAYGAADAAAHNVDTEA